MGRAAGEPGPGARRGGNEGMLPGSEKAVGTAAPGSPRRFRAYGVGLAKTGTTSLHGLFSRYRSAHEFLFRTSVRMAADFREGLIGRDQLQTFLLRRDREGGLEMDSSSFHFAYIEVLVETFPDALFLLTVRDCYSWFESAVTMCLTFANPVQDWMIEYGRRVNGTMVHPEVFASEDAFLEHLPGVIDGFLAHWAEGNRRVLRALPAGRSLVVRTADLSASVDRIANFVGVPRASLVRERAHLFKAPSRLPILRRADRGLVRERFEHHCGGLMAELFPGFSLADYLEGPSRAG